MKKIVFSLSFIAFAMFAFIACEKDQVTPLDTQTTVVEYTVLVVDGGTSFKSSAGLEGAAVTISSEGQPRTATTNSSGQATFSGLKPGVVAVTIEKDNFLTANYLADLKPTNAGDYDNIATRSSATRIVLIPTDAASIATVTIKVNADEDLSDTVLVADSPKGSVLVIASLSGGTGGLASSIGSDGSVSGMTIDGTVVTGTTVAGELTLELPAIQSGLTYSIAPQDYETSQTQADSSVMDNVFNVASQNVTVVPGGTYILEFNMAK